MIFSVLGANPPFDIIQGFIRRIWGNYDIYKMLQVKKGMFLVRFNNLQDKLSVEKRGVYYFDAKPVLVKGWNPQMDLHTEYINSLPIWIKLPDLDIRFWGIESLSKIGSILGIPLKTDRYTKEKRVIKYARLLIDMPLDGHFPDHIDFFNEEGILIRQQVHYEWKPVKCTHCKMFGHEDSYCKKKGGTRLEWRPVPQDKGEDNVQFQQKGDQLPTPNDGFTQVGKKNSAKQ